MNDYKGSTKSQRNPERASILCKEQPWGGFRMKQKSCEDISRQKRTYQVNLDY